MDYPERDFCIKHCMDGTARRLRQSETVLGVKKDPRVQAAYRRSIQKMRQDYCDKCQATLYMRFKSP